MGSLHTVASQFYDI